MTDTHHTERWLPMRGKVALVTGGSGGLGRAVALELSRRGAAVAVCARREAEGARTVEMIREAGGDGMFVRCDVSRADDVQRFVAAVVARFGRLDCAVNNAAIPGVFAKLTEYPEEVFDQVLNVDVKGTWLCMKYEIPEMISGGGGAIVNVSSVSGLVGVAFGGSPYSAAKHGIVGLSRCAAVEYGAAGVRVNALCPGGFPSEMNEALRSSAPDPAQALRERPAHYPLARRATVEEIARAAVWLCSDDASYITGAAIPVDGGFTAK